MIKTYRCAYTEYKIIVKPAIHGPEIKGGRKGEYIQFKNGLLKTANKEHQQILENDILFGVKLFIEEEEPDTAEELGAETPEELETQENTRRRGNPNFGKKTQE